MQNKPKLTPEEIVCKMKHEKGIRFKKMCEKDALEYLKTKNNYFRLASYRKNYDKHLAGAKIGQYINLDFGDLVELATLDMHLRFLLSKMCLDIEHSLKVKLLSDISANEREDGYNIVLDFLSKNERVIKDIYFKRNASYVCDLVNKYFVFETHLSNSGNVIFDKISHNCPVWAFLEIITFGDFICFYDFYYSEYPFGNNFISLLNPIKSLRNACAHNNCIIHNLRKSETKPGAIISKFIAGIKNISKEERKSRLKTRAVYELICILFVYDCITSDSLKLKRYTELRNLVDIRMIKNAIYFENQQIICASYRFIKKVVDFLT